VDIPCSEVKRCGKCQSAFYCNRACQVGAWPTHKNTCGPLGTAGGPLAWPAHKNTCGPLGTVGGPLAWPAHETTCGPLGTAGGPLEALAAAATGRDSAWAAVVADTERLAAAHDFAGVRVIGNALKKAADRVVEIVNAAQAVSIDSDAVLATAIVHALLVYIAAARVYTLIGVAVAESGDYSTALRLHQVAKDIVDEIDTEHGSHNTVEDAAEKERMMNSMKVETVSALAKAYQDVFEIDKARELYTWSLKFSPTDTTRSCNNRVAAMNGLARCHLLCGEWQHAQKHYVEVLAHDCAGTQQAIQMLGHMAMHERRHDACREHFAAALSRAYSLDDSDGFMAALVGAAEHELTRAAAGDATASERADAIIAKAATVASASSASTRDAEYVRVRLLMCIVVQSHAAGRKDEALGHVTSLLSQIAAYARERCWDCSQTRDVEHPIVSCSCCRIARFCDRNCQRRASAANCVETRRHAIQHKRLCPILRAHRLCGKRAGREDASREKLETLILDFIADERSLFAPPTV